MNSGDKNETVDTPPLMRKGQIGDVDFDNIFKTAKSWSENPYKRSHALNRIWQNFPENDVGASYFKFYSDLITLSTDITKFQPAGLVLVKVDVNAPEFALCSVVAAAFAAGCPVIIETKTLFKCFSYLSEELGGMITITRNQVNVLSMANKERVGRVVFLGTWNGTELKETYTYTFPHCLVYSFTPGYTAAFLMEQCDINSAVDTILLHTWGKGFKSNTWAVRNVVVFENTYEKFLNILKFRLEKYFHMDYPESKMLVDDLKDFKKRAIKAGAEILENSNLQSESVWGPTVALEYQEQGEGPELTIKVVICRTANEGVNLLNNLQYSHGISIWTDISSQALEAASLLNCCNIWVNSHGVVSADTQLTISGKGGSLICGGTDGIFQFLKIEESNNCLSVSQICEPPDECLPEVKHVDDITTHATQAFKQWSTTKDRSSFMHKIFLFLENKDLKNNDLHYYLQCANISNFFEAKVPNYYTVQKKLPIGIIIVTVFSENDYTSSVISICVAVALGNAVIVILPQKNEFLSDIFNKMKSILPNNVIQIITNEYLGLCLAQEENVQGFWLQSNVTSKYNKTYRHLRSHLNINGKHFWACPKNISAGSIQLFWHKCLKNKTIWLPNVEHLA